MRKDGYDTCVDLFMIEIKEKKEKAVILLEYIDIKGSSNR